MRSAIPARYDVDMVLGFVSVSDKISISVDSTVTEEIRSNRSSTALSPFNACIHEHYMDNKRIYKN